ncbi:hypothetical protein D9619_006531 [Psilocybe cf. subviscida]|uniref:ATP-dependent DNA helicase n=1 Tax=Psilocybe cf. subviscida TaxID=2480587 RepID=A0A8H5EXN1_9AGAR|nr:hypothetical protein D9619_006531 [Psilocybe cf. subviscida]
MNGVTRERTTLDPETGGLLLRRHHPNIAAYNDLVTVMMKSNTEVKYIGSGRAARDLVFYITDYVTKPTLPLHVGMTALQYAINKVNDTMAESTEGYTSGVNTKAVITAVNSMMGRHEISQPQVMSYLLGGGDHYTSEKFSTLNWGQILSYVDMANSATSADVTVEDSFAPVDAPLHIEVQNNSVTASSQALDYIFRSEQQLFNGMCLYEFAARGYKSAIPKTLLENKDINDIEGAFSSWDHPQRGTHYLRHRQHIRVPVLLGPTIPNPERSPDVKETWAKCIIILFKPWRHPRDMKADHQTWLEAYEQYKTNIPEEHLTIIRNMNAFAESKDARGTMPLRSRAYQTDGNTDMDGLASAGHTEDAINDFMSVDGDELDNEEGNATIIQDVFLCTDQSLPHSSILDDIASKRLGYGVIGPLDACKNYSSMLQDDSVLSDSNAREVGTDDQPGILSYETFMKEQKVQKVVQGTHPDINSRTFTSDRVNVRRAIDPFVEVMEIDLEDQYSKAFPQRAGAAPVTDIINDVIEKMNLSSNPEQLKAFNTVADHLATGKTDQLLMYVSGVGGTGKSHVIRSIITLFDCLGVRERLLLGAPTGIAAVLIRGQTLHSLTLINPGGKVGNLESLTAMWKDVRYLIIDEVSMIGARFLSQVSNRIREAKYHHPESCSQPFGGVNVIFMGDFGQLKPPIQSSLYAHSIVKTPAFRTASSVDGISAMNGALLWRQVTKVIELVRNQRQSQDPDYANFLSRIRLGRCVPHPNTFSVKSFANDWAYLQSRLMKNLDIDTLKTFEDAPIIVGNKSTRDVLNAKLIIYHSSRLGKNVNLYHSVDKIRRVPVRAGLQNGLWNLNSSINNDALGRLPLFSGMRVMVTENIAFSHGIVNGSEGVVEAIYYNENPSGVKTAVVALVYIAGCGLHLPGLEPDVVPIFPVSTRIDHKIKVDAQTICSGFTRKQLPLIPAYSYTDFKSQGRTLTYVIVDLYTARGQGVYVMLSRVKSIEGLAILRWFPPSKVYSRLSAELRDELERLNALSRA